MTNPQFTNTITFKSLDTEDPHAEIYFGEKDMVAIINQEKGIENPNIELWPKPDGKPWEFDMKDFQKAVKSAYLRLQGFQLKDH